MVNEVLGYDVVFTVERNGVELLRVDTLAELIGKSVENELVIDGTDGEVHIFAIENNGKRTCKNEGTIELKSGHAKFRFLGCK